MRHFCHGSNTLPAALPRPWRLLALVVLALNLGGCALFSHGSGVALDDRECLARVMYFESNRSSDDGMLAVGTVVMNRRASGRYPGSVCGVVGQPSQFAPGALTRAMTEHASRERAYRMADAVLAGQRHAGLENVMFFHTVGYSFPYSNMRYALVAGGNAFYEKRSGPVGYALVRNEDLPDGAAPARLPTDLAAADMGAGSLDLSAVPPAGAVPRTRARPFSRPGEPDPVLAEAAAVLDRVPSSDVGVPRIPSAPDGLEDGEGSFQPID